MSASAFALGASFDIDGKSYLLVRQLEDDIWQAEDLRTKRVVEFPLAQLRTSYVEGELIFAARDATRTQNPKQEKTLIEYPAEEWAAAKVRRAYVVDALDTPNSRGRIVPVIKATWQRLKQPAVAPNPSTVMNWKTRYLDSGKDIRSLISQSSKRGNKNARYPKEVELIVSDAIQKEYLCLEKGTFQAVLDNALAAVIRENNLRPASDQLPLPSMRLVRRKIEEVPAFDRHAARHGRTAATKLFRAVQAHRTTSAPLERAEIDHTQLDLMVLDDKSGLPLGRPWLTVCVDDFTRCILGLYVGFEPPSHATVASCLKHAFLPKVKLSKKYPTIKNEWTAHGVMRELVVDNGVEFHSISLENACFTLGIEIHYSARKTPWFKGKVERLIGTMNRAIAHGNPGTTFGNIFDKEEYDPSKHAIMRFSILLEVVNTWVADVYHQQIHRTLGAPPAAVWSKNVAPEDVMVPDDPALLDAILGQSETRQLNHKGIELYGLLYNSYELTALRRKLGTNLEVEVRVNPADLGKIVVLSPDKRQMFVAAALNPEYAAGVSTWQHKVCKRFAVNQMNAYDPSSWLEAKARIATLIDDELAHKKQSTRARIARYKGDARLLAKGDACPTEDAQISTAETSVPTISAVSLVSVQVQASDMLAPVFKPIATSPPTEPTTKLEPPKRKFKPVYRSRVLTFEDETAAHDD